jgi:hypothetical protein
VDTKIATIDNAVAKIKDTNVDTKITTIDTTVAKLTATDVDTKIATIDNAVAKIKDTNVDTKIATIDTTVALLDSYNVTTALSDINGAVESITSPEVNSSVAGLNDLVGTLTSSELVDSIETSTSTANKVIVAAKDIKDALDIINTTLTATTEAASNVAKAVSSLNAKKVSKILDPVIVKLGASLSSVLESELRNALAPILGNNQSATLGPTMNLGQSKARTPYDLGTGLTPCNPSQLNPNVSRANSNYQCLTTKKNIILTARVKIGNIFYILPCPIITHLAELKLLLNRFSMKKAIYIIAEKYNIDLQQKPVTNVKRYVYSTVDYKKVIPIKQFNTSFRLTTAVSGFDISINPNYILKKEDAKLLAIANDDTITLSYLYSDMIINATYWTSLIPSFTSPIYCIIRPMLGKITQLVSGILELRNNTIIFTPYINKYLMFLYKNMEINTNINIIYITKDFSEIIDYLSQVFNIIN